jgi:integrase
MIQRAPLTLSTPIVDFLEHRYLAERPIGLGSAKWYRSNVNRFGEWLERAPLLSDLNREAVNGFLQSLAGRYKPGTIRGARTSLRALWRRARIHEPLLEPATGLLVVPRWKDSRNGAGWSIDDVTKLLTAAANLPGNFRGKSLSRAAFWRSYILTAFETGLRHSNLARIAWSDVSPDGTLTARNQGNRPRTVTISDLTRQAIKATNPESRPFVFGVLERRYFFSAMQQLIRAAGLQGTGDDVRKAGATAAKVSPEQPATLTDPTLFVAAPAPVEPIRRPRPIRPQVVPKWREAEPTGNTETLYRYFARVYRPRKLLGKSPRTVDMYLETFDRFGDFLQHAPTLDDLTEEAVCGFLEWRLANGAAHHTTDKEGGKVKALANYAARKRHIPEFLDIPAINPPEILPTCWRREEVEKLFRACREARGRFGDAPRSVWWVTFHALCLATGERTEAMLSLTWDMLQGSTLSVPANIRKGKRKAARYRLPPSVLEELEQLRRFTTGRIFAVPWKDVFSSFYGHYTKLLKRAGLPSGRRFKPQCLRRTFASFLEAGGGDATEALGHTDRSVTRESYLDTSITLAGKEAAASIVWRELGLSSRPLAITHERQPEGAA